MLRCAVAADTRETTRVIRVSFDEIVAERNGSDDVTFLRVCGGEL